MILYVFNGDIFQSYGDLYLAYVKNKGYPPSKATMISNNRLFYS